MTEKSLLGKAGTAFAQAGRVLAGKQMAGRGATIFPDDVYLVSYPRSGNTWTRFLLGNLLHPDAPATFGNIEARVAEIYFNADHALRQIPRPRLLKSHEAFHPNYPRVIYIVRDPRDVAVSFYHHNVKAGNIPDDYAMDRFIPEFIAAKYDRRWGSWEDNVLSWLRMRQGRDTFLVLRYEDMKQDAVRELTRVANFLRGAGFAHLDVSAEKLEKAVQLSSPERMRELEKKEAGNFTSLKKTRLDKPFVRSAKAGGWKSALSRDAVRDIECAWGETMIGLGYALSDGAPTTRENPIGVR